MAQRSGLLDTAMLELSVAVGRCAAPGRRSERARAVHAAMREVERQVARLHLGQPPDAPPDPEDLVRRYVAAGGDWTALVAAVSRGNMGRL